jgi:hypothetical protein
LNGLALYISAADDLVEGQTKRAATKPISYEEFVCLRGTKEKERREGFVPKKQKKNATKIVTVSFLFRLQYIAGFVLGKSSSVRLLAC